MGRLQNQMIEEFKGEYNFLSNFWTAEVTLDGQEYKTVEHAYQAAKTFIPSERREVREASSPGKAKKLGRKVTLRSDWSEVRIQIMTDLVRQKFTKYYNLKLSLIATGDKYLQEGNYWGDSYWGYDLKLNRGENNLGKILMKIRKELQ